MMIDPSRRVLLDACFELKRRWQEYVFADEPDEAEGAAVAAQLSELSDTYRDRLPSWPVSRCPFCNEVLWRTLDDAGIDGLWWDYKQPIRALDESECAHWIGFTGAVQLARDEIVTSPLLAVTGPEVPFVVPRLLSLPSVRAVIGSRPIGPHRGFPIAYFTESPLPTDIKRVDDWGTNVHWYADPSGAWSADEANDLESDYDFDLRPWLDDGRLLYIAPNDLEHVLRRSSEDCPYLDLPGRRDIMKVQFGRAWGKSAEL